MAMHCELLEQNDWTEEDFKAGFQKGVAPRDGSKDLLKYEALLKRELAKGEVRRKSSLLFRRVYLYRVTYHIATALT